MDRTRKIGATARKPLVTTSNPPSTTSNPPSTTMKSLAKIRDYNIGFYR